MADVLNNVYEDVDTILKEHTELQVPHWEDFPDIPLYMDQVTELMERYLDVKTEIDNDHRSKMLTSSMVNNYVKMGIMPAPIKKKYYREHLAYLVMICLMKQSLSISVIGLFLQEQLKYMDIGTFYNLFVDIYRETFAKYVNQLRGINTEARHEGMQDPTQRARLGIIAVGIANAGKLTSWASDVVLRSEIKQEEERKKQAEKEAKEKAEREKKEKEKAEKEAKEQAEREKKEREKAEKEARETEKDPGDEKLTHIIKQLLD